MRKRTVCALLAIALVMMCFCFSVPAEEETAAYNLTVMEDDELMALLDSVKAELAARELGEGDAFYAGRYVVGEDIGEGNFLYTCVSSKNSFAYVSIYTLDENNEYVSDYGERVYPGDSFHVSLKEGEMLEVMYGYGFIREDSGDWAP